MPSGAVQRRLPASLREHPTFRLLFWGQALSVVGDRITPVAIAFAVLGAGLGQRPRPRPGRRRDPVRALRAGGRRVGRPRRPAPGHARLRHRPRALAERHRRAAAHGHRRGVDARGARLRLRHRRGGLHAGADGADPADREPGAPAGGQRAAGADAQHRERGRARRWPACSSVSAGSGEAIAVDAATFVVSALCLARMRLGAERPRRARGRRRRARALPGRPARAGGTRCARARG